MVHTRQAPDFLAGETFSGSMAVYQRTRRISDPDGLLDVRGALVHIAVDNGHCASVDRQDN